MEAEQVFEAEPRIVEQSARESDTSQSLSKGRNATVVAGGLEPAFAHEETPLLARAGIFDVESSDDFDRSDGQSDTTEEPPGSIDYRGLPWYRTPSIYWMLPSLFLHTLAYGAILVPKITIIVTLLCNNYFAHRSISDPDLMFSPVIPGKDVDPRCTDDETVQAMAAKFTLGLQLLGGLFSALTSPKLGSLSDRYGRIKMFVFTSTGVLVGEIVTILAVKYPQTVSVYWILVGSAIDGLTGSFTTAMAICNAYASDCTTPSRRGVAFGWMQGCLFTGIALGPMLATWIIKRTGNILVIFYVALIVHTTLMAYIALVVPESVTHERQMAARKRWELAWRTEIKTSWYGNTIYGLIMRLVLFGRDLFEPLKILWPTGKENPKLTSLLRRNLVLLAAVDTVQFGVAMGTLTVLILYTAKTFHWDTGDTSLLVGITSTSRVIVLMVVLPIVTWIVRGRVRQSSADRKMGSDWLDLCLIWTALIFDIAAFAGYATAKVGTVFIMSGCIGSVGGMGSPTIQSSLTKHVPVERTGQILGAMGLLHALARVVSPTIFSLIWARTNQSYPQLVWLCLCATFAFTLIMSLFIRPHIFGEQSENDNQIVHEDE